VSSGSIGERLSVSAYEHARTVLDRLRVTVLEGHRAVRFEAGVLHTHREPIAFDLAVVSAGFEANSLARDSGLPVDAHGRVPVSTHLSVAGHEDIFVAGDAAVVQGHRGSPVVAGCKTAMPTAAHAVDNIVASIQGKSLQDLDWRDLLLCISLGRNDGLVQPMNVDGMPLSWSIHGRPGAWIKEAICRFTVSALWMERRGLPYAWIHTGRTAQLLAASSPTS
jgi:NADH dehydrogenase FAD-containing subunit